MFLHDPAFVRIKQAKITLALAKEQQIQHEHERAGDTLAWVPDLH